jgi:glutathione reductase (NADPH)
MHDTWLTMAENTGMNLHKNSNVKKVEKNSSGSLTVHIDSLDKPLENVDVLLWAIGRHANTEHLSPEVLKLEMDKQGDIIADKYQETNVPDVYALGDVAGKVLLTPVAIAAGRRLSNRLFGGEKYKDDHLDYDNIASVVFS